MCFQARPLAEVLELHFNGEKWTEDMQVESSKSLRCDTGNKNPESISENSRDAEPEKKPKTEQAVRLKRRR